MLHIVEYKKYDVMNGPGVRCSIWLSGCSNKCKDCWAVKTWNANFGTTYQDDKDVIEEIIKNPMNDGISLLGGDPLYHFFNGNIEEQQEVLDILKTCKKYDKNVWLWTGYLFEDIKKQFPKILEYVDTIVDGKFDITKKDMKLYFRGSSNQRIINVKATLKNNEISLMNY